MTSRSLVAGLLLVIGGLLGAVHVTTFHLDAESSWSTLGLAGLACVGLGQAVFGLLILRERPGRAAGPFLIAAGTVAVLTAAGAAWIGQGIVAQGLVRLGIVAWPLLALLGAAAVAMTPAIGSPQRWVLLPGASASFLFAAVAVSVTIDVWWMAEALAQLLYAAAGIVLVVAATGERRTRGMVDG